MDVFKALRELYLEKKRLDAAIASLEARLKAGRTGSEAKSSKGRRGRKGMSAAERMEVSQRMTQYWQTRRAQASESASPNTTPEASGEEQASTTVASS